MFDAFKKGFLSAFGFIVAFALFGGAVATWNAGMRNVAPGEALSSSGWNAVVQNVLDLNSRVSGLGTRVWVNFDGRAANCATTCVLNGYSGVSSVVRNGEGDYTINFSIPLQDGNYAVSGISMPYSASNVTGASTVTLYPSGAGTYVPLLKTANSVRILTGNPYTGGVVDSGNVSVSIIR